MTAQEYSDVMLDIARERRHIASLRFRLSQARNDVEKRRQNLEQLVRELESAREEKKQTEQAARAGEIEAESAAAELARRREQLDLSRSGREYDALQQQIAVDSERNDRLAEETLALFARVDELAQTIETISRQGRGERAEWQTRRTALAELEKETAEKIRTIEERIEQIVAEQPRNLASAYKTAVEKFGPDDACCVLLEDNYCGNCQCGVPLNDALRVKSGEPAFCSSCGRMLYPDIKGDGAN